MVTRETHDDGIVSWVHTDGRWEVILPDGKEVTGIARDVASAQAAIQTARAGYNKVLWRQWFNAWVEHRRQLLEKAHQLSGGRAVKTFTIFEQNLASGALWESFWELVQSHEIPEEMLNEITETRPAFRR